MKVIARIIMNREVEIPDKYFISSPRGRYKINDTGYFKFMGENSSLLKENEECVIELFDLENQLIAEY